ncbi:MAG: YraN family protein [Candidatus Omnitrophica bacterium]|nr:YraN family protein [Candidatus Omnitrophota bacterium]MBU4457225.1 YraN family protein [Candidatus Omnitrophota bacterium]
MTIARIKSGELGEALAASYLKKQGYKIIEKNYRTRYGEIDIIGDDKGCISFVEVRSSNNTRFDSPEYSIDRTKQNKLAKMALSYIKRRHLEEDDCRFDVVCIEGVNSDSPKVRLIKNAFELNSWYKY